MNVALAQLNPTVGALDDNVAQIQAHAEQSQAAGARLLICPELALTGYPPRDLLDRPSFIDDVYRSLDTLCQTLPPELVCLVGTPTRVAHASGRRLHNSVAVIRDGRITDLVHKRLLPSYDVFDEDRWFEPGTTPGLIEVDGLRVGITICEDAWNSVALGAPRRYAVDPVAEVVAKGADVIVNLCASPFTRTKRLFRDQMFAAIAKAHQRPVVLVNQVGAHDDLIFDGQSGVFDANGSALTQLPAFEEALVVSGFDTPGPSVSRPQSDEAALLDALVLGVRDYARRCGFSRAVIGLSGGIDSALTAAIAVRALGSENVHGVAMPSRYSSEHSVTDAKALADALGMSCDLVPIEPMFKAYVDALSEPLERLCEPHANDVTFENIQARIRCGILMAYSNRSGALLLTTGNKSEVAVGYCTLYGDMAGGLGVLSDVFKTVVYRVAEEFNRQAGRDVIPESTMTKPPSAELRPDQKDEDSLPPYADLDALLERYVERSESMASLIAAGFDEAMVRRVCRLVRLSEYKRRQMPPGLIVTGKAFMRGRRYPIAQGYRG